MREGKRTTSAILFVFFACLVSAVIFAHSGAEAAAEKILSFDSSVKVYPDSSLEVRENIRVAASGDRIKRGIYRDFPIRYKDRQGNNYRVDFQVISASRDGRPESYRLERRSNGVRVYLGKSNIYLSPGEYDYTLVYRTNRQLGFFKDFDELYWNVTGNGWDFPIERASAVVDLPQGAEGHIRESDAYTGYSGSKGRDFTVKRDLFGDLLFETTRPLAAREGLTIVVSWPKGYVAEPDFSERAGYFFRDNLNFLVGIIGMALLLGYYLFVWHLYGRDPQKGVIIPIFDPPDKLSPAEMRYLVRMGYDHHCFAASVINMAVKGYLKIIDIGGVFMLKRTDSDEAVLTQQEKELAKTLLFTDSELLLKKENHEIVSAAIRLLKRALAKKFENLYFFSNLRYFVPGVVFSVLLMVLVLATSQNLEKTFGTVFMTVWLTIWTFVLSALIFKTPLSFSAGKKGAKTGPGLFYLIFLIPFILGELFGLFAFIHFLSFWMLFIMAGVVGINFLFYRLLKAPTVIGRRKMDRIEGFKMYLSVTEKDKLNLLNPPEKTPELFEKYLPYAFALDVDQAWCEQFAGVLAAASQTTEGYSPGWYTGSGNWRNTALSGVAARLGGSLSAAISSSSVAPGSSSGGGGGGSSGGGGGGGGGGGW